MPHSSSKPRRVVRGRDSRTNEGAYVACLIAGSMTKTNTLGVVGSIPIPEVIRNINSFTLGKVQIEKDKVADDEFLGGIKFYVKGVEGKVPGDK